MIAEIGHFSLILALAVALVQAVLPMVGAARNNAAWMATAAPTALVQLACIATAFGCLMTAFVTSDFTVANVMQNSNSLQPMIYKVSATWGNHEGSMVLWVLILAVFGAMVAAFGGNLPPSLKARVLSVQSMTGVGFLLFILLTSNPFERVIPAPLDGRDLNPLLQDPGLAFHPPMLYVGYVGFSMAFSFAIAALIEGKVDAAWARWVRPWTLVAWSFLTAGIGLGAWWAYYELGWGGWWFWDPVENASFMPWLIGTALIHSQAVTEKRNLFKSWSVLLAIFAFSFSLLGTFLVRSGVLTSVHAFAADPERGMFILLILGFTIGGSLLLYAFNAAKIKTSGSFELVSRESFLLMNNILLVVIAFAVLFGTLLPLLADAFSWRKLSVGAPFFNSVFNFLMVFLLSLLGIGQLLRWKKHNKKGWRITLLIMLVSAVVIALILPWTLSGKLYWQVWLGMALVFWVVASLVNMVIERTRNSRSFIAGIRKAGVGFWGMWLAHLGLVVSTTGVVLVSNFDIEKDYRVEEGDSVQLNNYRFDVDRFQIIQGPNYVADRGVVSIYRDDKKVAEVNPEKRYYSVQGNVMTEAGIDGSLLRDLYVSMAEPLDDSRKVWSVRLQVKPFVSWLWWGAALMALGSIVSITDRRYRLKTSSASVEKTL